MTRICDVLGAKRKKKDNLEARGVNGILTLKVVLWKSVGRRGLHCYGCVRMRYVRYTSYAEDFCGEFVREFLLS